VWREIRLTFTYGGSRRANLFVGLSALFLYKALRDFFSRPEYEGDLLGSFWFPPLAVLAYFIAVTSLQRALAARQRAGRDQKTPEDGHSNSPSIASKTKS
jgi:hypothetical protein